VKEPKLTNIAASVKARLLNEAKRSNRPYTEVLQYFAMERFLYRLSKSRYVTKFVLKGALMLAVWHAPIQRPTKDIDMLGKVDNQVDSVVNAIHEICLQKVEPDGLMFQVDGIEGTVITEDAEYHGIRVRFMALLEKTEVPIQVDIGFGDPVVPRVALIAYPTMLDMPAPKLRGYSRESAVAEKFEAIAKRGLLNSRVKDIYDIWLLSRLFEFDGQVLAKAIQETFKSRGKEIHARPVGFTKLFYDDAAHQNQWKAFISRNRIKDAPGSLGLAVKAVSEFLSPILDCLASKTTAPIKWTPPGPWHLLDS